MPTRKGRCRVTPTKTGSSANRATAADDPVFVGVTRHRPFPWASDAPPPGRATSRPKRRACRARISAASVELQAAVITARALRMPHQVDELATVLRLRFELDDDHDLADRRSFLDDFGHRCAIRHVKASARSRTAGDSTPAYNGTCTTYADGRWPEEPLHELLARGWQQFDEPIRTPAWRNLALMISSRAGG